MTPSHEVNTTIQHKNGETSILINRDWENKIEEYPHDHLFEQISYQFSLQEHNACLLLKCITCGDTFCNWCGRKITETPSPKHQMESIFKMLLK